MTYRFTQYIPPMRTTGLMKKEIKPYCDERIQASIRKRRDDWKQAQVRMKLAHDQQLALQARDAEAARIEAERIANLPTPEQTEYPIAGLHFVNGVVQPAKENVVSQAVIKTNQLRAANLATHSKRNNCPSKHVEPCSGTKR